MKKPADEFAAGSVWAVDSDQENELIRICALEEPELVNRLFAFAEEAHDVATDLEPLVCLRL